MRTRDKERFIRMNFTEDELEIRNKLYRNRNLAKYKMVITQEHYKKRKHQLDNGTYKSGCIAYFSDYPEDGIYIDTIYFYEPWQYKLIVKLYEGLFYQLFDINTGKRIGYGSLDPDSPVEDIREATKNEKCCCVCSCCFWHNMIYGETELSPECFNCYHPEYRKEK